MISGGGGAHITQLRKPGRGGYAQSINGFTHLQVSREKLVVRHLDERARQIHAFSKTPDGRLELLV